MLDGDAADVLRTCVDGRIHLVNPAFAALAGYASPEALLASVGEVAELYAVEHERARAHAPRLGVDSADGAVAILAGCLGG